MTKWEAVVELVSIGSESNAFETHPWNCDEWWCHTNVEATTFFICILPLSYFP